MEGRAAHDRQKVLSRNAAAFGWNGSLVVLGRVAGRRGNDSPVRRAGGQRRGCGAGRTGCGEGGFCGPGVPPGVLLQVPEPCELPRRQDRAKHRGGAEADVPGGERPARDGRGRLRLHLLALLRHGARRGHAPRRRRPRCRRQQLLPIVPLMPHRQRLRHARGSRGQDVRFHRPALLHRPAFNAEAPPRPDRRRRVLLPRGVLHLQPRLLGTCRAPRHRRCRVRRRARVRRACRCAVGLGG